MESLLWNTSCSWEDGKGGINIILPPKDIQNEIGNPVFEAYDKRDKANQIEDEAIKLLERRLKEITERKM